MLEPVQQGVINTVKRLEDIMWGKAERVGTVQPEERRPRRIFTHVNSRWRGQKKTEPNSSQSHPVTGQGAIDTNWNAGSSIWMITVRVAEHWKRLSREVAKSPSLEILQSHLHLVLGYLLQMALLWVETISRIKINSSWICTLKCQDQSWHCQEEVQGNSWTIFLGDSGSLKYPCTQ